MYIYIYIYIYIQRKGEEAREAERYTYTYTYKHIQTGALSYTAVTHPSLPGCEYITQPSDGIYDTQKHQKVINTHKYIHTHSKLQSLTAWM